MYIDFACATGGITGAVPIEQVGKDVTVFAPANDLASPVLDLDVVSHQIVIGEASLVRLIVRRLGGSSETIETTDEHPFRVVGVTF